MIASKYEAMLQEAFEPFILCNSSPDEILFQLTTLARTIELKRFPLFAALTITRS